MVFGLLNPINMVLSMLLMQGISLNMFRNIVNQTIRNNNNPLKWSVSFGNDNKTINAGSSEAERTNESSSPLVDPRLMDLVNLLRVLGNQQQAASTNQIQSTPLTIAQPPSIVQTHQPLIAAFPVKQATQARSSIPQIIIVPQLLKESSSDNIEMLSKISEIASEAQNGETFAPEGTIRTWSKQEDKILRKIFKNKSKNSKKKNRKPTSVADLKEASNHRYEEIIENDSDRKSFVDK